MSQFETSEVMVKYASIVAAHDGFIKEAWTWRDIVTELGVGAAIDASIAAGAVTWAAGGVASVTAASLAWPVTLAVLSGAALSMGIWYLTRQMDDNLIDLIDRIGDLDPNEYAEATVQDWLNKLEQFKSVMKIPPTTTNPEERAMLNGQKVMGMRRLYEYLLQMQSDWPQVKTNLTDWGFDEAQAEHAINETVKAVSNAFTQAQKYAQQQAKISEKTIIKQIEKKISETGIAGKGKKKPGGFSSVVKGLQAVLNKINYAKHGGAGIIREDGIYGGNTADALIGVVSSDWAISKAIAQNAKADYNTMRDIKYMRNNPNLIRKIYRILSGIADNKYVIPMAGGTGERKKQRITRERTRVEPSRPMSVRDIRRELTS